MRPRRKAIEPKLLWAVLDAPGPSDSLKLLWLQFWSHRDARDQVKRRTQAELTALLGYGTERTLRARLAEAGRWGMLTNHAGAWGGASRYHVRPPHLWFTAPQPDRRALRPPKRTPVEARTAVEVEPRVCDVSDGAPVEAPAEGMTVASLQRDELPQGSGQ